jgi:hypothetical protein
VNHQKCPTILAPVSSPLTTRDFGTDDLDSPVEEVPSPPDDGNGARDWGGSRLAGGRARLAAAAAAAELATL